MACLRWSQPCRLGGPREPTAHIGGTPPTTPTQPGLRAANRRPILSRNSGMTKAAVRESADSKIKGPGPSSGVGAGPPGRLQNSMCTDTNGGSLGKAKHSGRPEKHQSCIPRSTFSREASRTLSQMFNQWILRIAFIIHGAAGPSPAPPAVLEPRGPSLGSPPAPQKPGVALPSRLSPLLADAPSRKAA